MDYTLMAVFYHINPQMHLKTTIFVFLFIGDGDSLEH